VVGRYSGNDAVDEGDLLADDAAVATHRLRGIG
jgi:hypothetical protein